MIDIARRASRIEFGLQELAYRPVAKLPLRYGRHELGEQEVRLTAVESKVLVATVALQQVLPTHTEKLRWAMKEMDYQLGIMANFYPPELDVQFFRRR